jgi:hypothetical protein
LTRTLSRTSVHSSASSFEARTGEDFVYDEPTSMVSNLFISTCRFLVCFLLAVSSRQPLTTPAQVLLVRQRRGSLPDPP